MTDDDTAELPLEGRAALDVLGAFARHCWECRSCFHLGAETWCDDGRAALARDRAARSH